jgi:hypothetical protein
MPICTPPTWRTSPSRSPGERRSEVEQQRKSRVRIPRRNAVSVTIQTEPTDQTNKRFAVRSVATACTPISTPPATSSTAGEIANYAPARTGKQSKPCCCSDIRNGSSNTVGRSPTARPVRSSTGVGQGEESRQCDRCLDF